MTKRTRPEQTFNHGVEGSSPSALTMKIKDLAENPKIDRRPCVGKSIAARDFGARKNPSSGMRRAAPGFSTCIV